MGGDDETGLGVLGGCSPAVDEHRLLGRMGRGASLSWDERRTLWTHATRRGPVERLQLYS